jgi:MoxR-like ATPase
MLWGPPGVGKSQLVAQVAENHDAAIVDVRLSQMEPSDLRGIPFKNDQKVEWAIPAMLPDVDVHGAAGILFIDEITSAPPSVSAAAYQLILDRRLGEYRVPEHWAIVAAGNRQGDRGVTYSMPAPLANRFSHYEVDVNLDDWVAWAYRNAIDERVIGFLRFRPDLSRAQPGRFSVAARVGICASRVAQVLRSATSVDRRARSLCRQGGRGGIVCLYPEPRKSARHRCHHPR